MAMVAVIIPLARRPSDHNRSGVLLLVEINYFLCTCFILNQIYAEQGFYIIYTLHAESFAPLSTALVIFFT